MSGKMSVFSAFLFLSAVPAAHAAGDQFGAFKEFVDRGSLRPFTRDLGGVLGSATFHKGRVLGLLGYDIGVHGGMQFRPSKGDDPLHRAGVKAFGLPWVQAEVGLPFQIDGFIRGVSYQGLTIAGGGLRYGPFKINDEPWKPQTLVSWVGHSVAHKDFSASHLGLNLVISMGNYWFTPYVAGGVDRTRVVVRAVPDLDPALVGESETTTEARYTAGFEMRPYPFTNQQTNRFFYLQSAVTLAHGQPGVDLGLGLRF